MRTQGDGFVVRVRTMGIMTPVALVYLAGTVFGQTGNSKHASTPARALTPAEQAAVIEQVREHALTYTKQLPNYICTQLTRQKTVRHEVSRQSRVLGGGRDAIDEQEGRDVIEGQDVIEEQISSVDHREIHTVVSINGHRVAADGPDQKRGTPSRGEFGAILEVIFDPQSPAELKWERPRTLDRRPVYVLSYRVPQSKGYTLTESKQQIQVPYQGLVYADAETLALVRIEMKITPRDIPKNSEYAHVELTLDYKPGQVAGSEFILPAHYSLQYSMKQGVVSYDADYTNYRRFSADATIQFEDEKNH